MTPKDEEKPSLNNSGFQRGSIKLTPGFAMQRKSARATPKLEDKIIVTSRNTNFHLGVSASQKGPLQTVNSNNSDSVGSFAPPINHPK